MPTVEQIVACPYRGDPKRKVELPKAGPKGITVYECREFGECVLLRNLEGMKRCFDCPKRPRQVALEPKTPNLPTTAAVTLRIKALEPPCVFREESLGEVEATCPQGKRKVNIPSYRCSSKGCACTVNDRWLPIDKNVVMCRLCKERKAEADDRKLMWQVGVTTVLSRKDDLLPRTLTSLAKAGWENPRLFVDGGTPEEWQVLKRPMNVREKTNAYANWWLGMHELYVRNPLADRYMMVQDDVLFTKGLRDYLDKCPWPGKGYLNLYTFPQNQVYAKDKLGFFMPHGDKMGLGALALVFNRESIIKILASEHMVEKFRPFDFTTNQTKEQSHRAKAHIDGGVVSAMRKAGMMEWCHNPSLVQHLGGGKLSTLNHGGNPDAVTFEEDYPLMKLLGLSEDESEEDRELMESLR